MKGAAAVRVQVTEALAVFGRVALIVRVADWPDGLPPRAAAVLLDAKGRRLGAGTLGQAHLFRDPAVMAVEVAPDAPLARETLRAVAAVEAGG